MKKFAYTLVELIIYAFIISFIAIYLIVLSRHFYQNAAYNLSVLAFAQNYNSLLKNMYGRSIEGWTFTGNYNSGTVMTNSGNYFAYGCYEDGISISYESTGIANIDWNNHLNIFTGFECINISGWTANSGYWLELDIEIIDREMDLKYYFN